MIVNCFGCNAQLDSNDAALNLEVPYSLSPTGKRTVFYCVACVEQEKAEEQ